MARRKRQLVSLAAVFATLLGGIALTLLGQGNAQAHGVTMTPGSRTYLCWLDARTSTGSLDPTNPACKAALSESGSTALYNWFAVLDSNAGGRGAGYVLDGKLCSAGDRRKRHHPGCYQHGSHETADDPTNRFTSHISSNSVRSAPRARSGLLDY